METFADIDECQQNNGGCSDSCINTLGSFYCECDTGHKLNTDKATCVGMLTSYINEISAY